jgi:hypothetical protein
VGEADAVKHIDWADRARSSTKEEFVAQCPFHFLVGRRQFVRAVGRSTGLFVPISSSSKETDNEPVMLSADRSQSLNLVLPICKADRHPGPITVGRTDASDLVLEETLISRAHAAFVVEGDRLLLRDLGSANGTFVADERLEEAGGPRPVGAGDIVRFAHLEFELVDSATAWERLRTGLG